ncbi:MAG: hypothetical protein QW279_02030 [Candidatus Jordarchaeaceae archaeon]
MKISKQKKKILAAILILAIFIPLATMIINNQNNTPLPLTNQPNNNNNPFLKSSGTGGTLQALLTQTNNTNTTTIQTNTTTDFTINCPTGWNITYANITLTNIKAPNCTLVDSNYPSNSTPGYAMYPAKLMSLKITNPTAYIELVSIYIDVQSLGDITFSIYNASNDGGVPKPSSQIPGSSKTLTLSSTGTYWANRSYDHYLVNSSQTYDGYFFISASVAMGVTCYWQAVAGTGYTPNGYAYDGFTKISNADLKLNVSLSAGNPPDPESVYPSNIT